MVVGAGTGGLVAVLAMSRIADQVALLEWSEQPAEVGAPNVGSQRDGGPGP